MKIEVLRVDAMHDGEGWSYNYVDYIGTLETSAGDVKRALYHYLRSRGYHWPARTMAIYDDGYCWEMIVRKTGEPVMMAREVEV